MKRNQSFNFQLRQEEDEQNDLRTDCYCKKHHQRKSTSFWIHYSAIVRDMYYFLQCNAVVIGVKDSRKSFYFPCNAIVIDNGLKEALWNWTVASWSKNSALTDFTQFTFRNKLSLTDSSQIAQNRCKTRIKAKIQIKG